jgi:hypothetical protein
MGREFGGDIHIIESHRYYAWFGDKQATTRRAGIGAFSQSFGGASPFTEWQL